MPTILFTKHYFIIPLFISHLILFFLFCFFPISKSIILILLLLILLVLKRTQPLLIRLKLVLFILSVFRTRFVVLRIILTKTIFYIFIAIWKDIWILSTILCDILDWRDWSCFLKVIKLNIYVKLLYIIYQWFINSKRHLVSLCLPEYEFYGFILFYGYHWIQLSLNFKGVLLWNHQILLHYLFMVAFSAW